MKALSVQEFLKHHFELKKNLENGHFSLRSYAQLLGISPGRLTSLLGGENIPTLKTAQKISRALRLTPQENEQFLSAIDRDKKKRLLNKADVLIRQEDLHIVVDWVPYAIISLLMTHAFELTPTNVADRLNISPEDADTNIRKLKELRMIELLDGKWRPSKNKIATETDIPSEMIRRSHQEKISLALKRLSEVEVHARDYSSITFPAAPENLEAVKKMIIDFRRTLAESMSIGCSTEVYSLNIQLFPLTFSPAPVKKPSI